MKNSNLRSMLRLAPMVAVLLLAGCGSLSNVSREGTTNTPVFPDPSRVSLQDGTFVDPWSVTQIQAGMTRNQVYDLIGRPHFSKGFRSREWDYLFHFRTDGGVRTCQFKILFDQGKITRSFYWSPNDCRPGTQQVAQQATSAPQKFNLSGDLSFGFGSVMLTVNGRSHIAKIAEELRSKRSIEQIEIVGHTDYIGSDAANDSLSKRRAEAVRQALVAHGVTAGAIRVAGYGKRQPLVQCDQQDRSQLIACLAPNRRVEIRTIGYVE